MIRDRMSLLIVLFVVGLAGGLVSGYLASAKPSAPARTAATTDPRARLVVHSHLDHSPFFTQPFSFPQDVTRACLQCHRDAANEVMATAHWRWAGEPVAVSGQAEPQSLGKRNLINNFCISITGNEAACTQCHAGYGWVDDSFDFTRGENVDCLICHERTGGYIKNHGGLPAPGTDLLAAARSVGYPRRENCGGCHSYGGGGLGVKHGDLDASLDHPDERDDVHMGRIGMLCIDCHRTSDHRIAGRSFSVSVEGRDGVACTDCHAERPHDDARLDGHVSAVACETCHIPTYARRVPTKTSWDWSLAGDSTRVQDPHEYLRIKGEFRYGQNLMPEYFWFNRTVDRYLMGDRIDSTRVTDLNRPRGSPADPAAKIWPFKVHRALQPFDRRESILLTPVTGGAGGYWQTFDWDSALRLGAEAAELPFSGSYGFAQTAMYWPLAHMVASKEEALGCTNCHGETGRLDWPALGYAGDPLRSGGRP